MERCFKEEDYPPKGGRKSGSGVAESKPEILENGIEIETVICTDGS